MRPQPPRSLSLLCAALCGVMSGACEQGPLVPRTPVPLQPLVFTVRPDLTPEANAVRERRLMRELLEGASAGHTWGRLSRPPSLPQTVDAAQLGQALFDALVKRDEGLWEHAFISPRSYAALVHVKEEKARERIDEFLASAQPVWALFDIERVSEAPEGGLGAVFKLVELRLGQGRDLHNRRASDPRDIVQYWGNTLVLGLHQVEGVVFELSIPKIIRTPDLRKASDGRPMLAVASKLSAPAELETFIAAGLHLKPELLRSQDYPYPLAVGNFWRYHRRKRDEAAPSAADASATPPTPSRRAGRRADPTADELDLSTLITSQSSFDADEVLLEITAMERYGTMRLVKLRWSYNDQELTKREDAWLVTPRRIYTCARACQRRVDNLDWMLRHLRERVPLFEFPLRPGQSWGQTRRSKKPTYQTAQRVEDVTVPAGIFIATLPIEGISGRDDPFIQVTAQRRDMARSQGVVRRRLEGRTRKGDAVVIVEELVESRIMP